MAERELLALAWLLHTPGGAWSVGPDGSGADLLQTAHEQVRTAIATGATMPHDLARFLPDDHRAELLRGG